MSLDISSLRGRHIHTLHGQEDHFLETRHVLACGHHAPGLIKQNRLNNPQPHHLIAFAAQGDDHVLNACDYISAVHFYRITS